MVIFEYRCMHGEPIEVFYPLGAAPDEIRCTEHNTVARKRIARGEFVAFPGSDRFDHRSS